MKTIVGSLFAAVILSVTPATAQIRPGDAGFQMKVGSVTTGTLCRGFQCTPYQASAARPSTVELFVRGAKNQPFVVMFAAGAQNCLTVPGFYHSLILSFPIPVVIGGVMSQQDFIRACPGGIGTLKFTIPANLPAKAQFSMQAVATSFGTNGLAPAFTAAILVTLT